MNVRTEKLIPPKRFNHKKIHLYKIQADFNMQ